MLGRRSKFGGWDIASIRHRCIRRQLMPLRTKRIALPKLYEENIAEMKVRCRAHH